MTQALRHTERNEEKIKTLENARREKQTLLESLRSSNSAISIQSRIWPSLARQIHCLCRDRDRNKKREQARDLEERVEALLWSREREKGETLKRHQLKREREIAFIGNNNDVGFGNRGSNSDSVGGLELETHGRSGSKEDLDPSEIKSVL